MNAEREMATADGLGAEPRRRTARYNGVPGCPRVEVLSIDYDKAAVRSDEAEPGHALLIVPVSELSHYVFGPRASLPVAVGEVDARPKGEAFNLRIELGNEAMNTAANVADALARCAATVEETGSWEGTISDGNGNTVGHYLLSDEEAV